MLLVIVAFASISFGLEPSPKRHFYFVEYKRPIEANGKVATLSVVFYDRIEGRKAEDFLRSELNKALILYPATWDILAKAYYSSGDVFSEKNIKLSDGSSSLIYDSKQKRVFTSIQLWGTNVPPLRPKK